MATEIITTSNEDIARRLLHALQHGSAISVATDEVVTNQHQHRGRHPRELLEATKVGVMMGEECCYMRPPDDYIVLPPRSWFSSDDSYWSTVLHELVHRSEWILGFTGSEGAGELRAEAGVALLESILGLPHCPDQTNYRLWRQAWMREWQDDPASMMRAVASGVEAAEFLLSYLDDAERAAVDPQVEQGMNALVEQIMRKRSLESSTPTAVTSLAPKGKHEQQDESSPGNHRPDHPSP